MTNEEKNKIEQNDIFEQMQEEIRDFENENGGVNEEEINNIKNGELNEEKVDEINNLQEEKISQIEKNPEEEKCRDILAKTMADFENFKKRTERDKDDMIFFLKSDIFKKILPRLDDLERILKNTPENFREGALYEGLISVETKFKKDIEGLGIKSFQSKGQKVDPEKHDVMTTVAGQKEGIIFDEFEKGYMLGDKVLRHAKVIAGAGE